MNLQYTNALIDYIVSECARRKHVSRVDLVRVSPQVYSELRSEGAITLNDEDALGVEAREVSLLPDFWDEAEEDGAYIMVDGKKIEIDESDRVGLVTLIQRKLIFPDRFIGRSESEIFGVTSPAAA